MRMPAMPGEHRVDRLQLEVPSDLGPDELEPAHLEAGQPGLAQPLLDLLRGLLEGAARRGNPDQVLLGVAELLDDAVAQADPVERLPHGVDRRRLLEAHLHERAPGEVDAVPEPALPGDVAQPGQGHDEGDDDRPSAAC